MERYLDATEESWILGGGWEGMQVAAYRGEVDESRLRNSFDALCQKFPALRGKITEKADGYQLQVTDSDVPLFCKRIVKREEDLRYKLLSEQEERAERSNQQPSSKIKVPKLARLIFCPGKPTGYIVLAMQHLLTSAGTGAIYMREFWNLYDQSINGEKSRAGNVGRLPESPVKLLNERWGLIKQPDTDHSNIIEKDQERFTHAVKLSRDQTARISGNARSLALSINGLLIGETIAAMGLCYPSGTETKSILCRVGMHNRISPPVGPLDTTFFSGFITEYLKSDNSPVAIGQEFNYQLRKSISEKSVRIQGFNTSNPTVADVDLSWNGAYGGLSYAAPRGIEIQELYELHVKDRTSNTRYTRKAGSIVPGRPLVSAACFTLNYELTLVLDMPVEKGHQNDFFLDQLKKAIYSRLS